MATGIAVTCHRRFGQFLITEQPSLITASMQVAPLRWGGPTFVPMPHGPTSPLVIQFPYLGKACGVVQFAVDLRAGEVQSFEYKAPFIVYSTGTIYRTS